MLLILNLALIIYAFSATIGNLGAALFSSNLDDCCFC